MMRPFVPAARRAFLAGLTLAFASAAAVAQTSEVVDLPVRADAVQRVLLLMPATEPKAAVLLYPGGSGNIKLEPDGTIGKGDNFLIRSRDLFVERGLLTVLVDRPSDWAGSDADHYRASAAHADDARAILELVRKRTVGPIWLIGTSRGSISAAHIARSLGPDALAGIVLTATVTRPGGRRTQTVHDIALTEVGVPVLILGHEDDDCAVSPWSDQQDLIEDLANSPRKEAIGLEGGDHGDLGAPCKSQSHHGFLGLELETVAKIAEWITGGSR